MRHTVTEAELTKWSARHWVRFAASAGEFSNKHLEMSMDRLYRVTDRGSVCYIGGNAQSAIKEYNDAP